MSQPLESLMHANLFEVFGERDPDRRRAAIERTYAPDVEFLDPDEVVTGHDALHTKAQRLLDEAPGFVFSPAGPVYENHGMGYLAWHFGPEGQPPVVSGMDICFVEGDVIAKVYTLLTS
ncbi:MULTISPECIES: nuclear transport factor 2 family protein [unclassified Curtobacterium]|uniref:nuclear transport factor 2 family protein n=1 Tax=unclassified Curtobacterium TaxID=257496 RepID=UPI0021AD3CBF|nr:MULTISPECIES: nuclear transport factor 2 family protein [unclassified Curtobacterium]